MSAAMSMFWRWVAIVVLALGGVVSAQPGQINGKVVGVHDGDSITVLTADKQQLKVRLEGIDAPELGQPFGQASKQAMSALVFGKNVVLNTRGKDRYKRTLAVVFVGQSDANLQMVRMGLAWRYDAYSQDPALLAAQAEAKMNRRGLWADPLAMPPWQWRKQGK